jgi:hypothetical protein
MNSHGCESIEQTLFILLILESVKEGLTEPQSEGAPATIWHKLNF